MYQKLMLHVSDYSSLREIKRYTYHIQANLYLTPNWPLPSSLPSVSSDLSISHASSVVKGTKFIYYVIQKFRLTALYHIGYIHVEICYNYLAGVTTDIPLMMAELKS